MQKIEDWSNARLAHQCVFPRLNTTLYFSNSEYRMSIEVLVRNGIGGFCIFEGNTITVKQMTEQLQTIADVPLLFAADFENGLSMRLEEGTDFPHAMALGVADDLGMTARIAQAIAKEAKDLGVLWNFAPVCDANSNPRNPIINIRSFGSDFGKVAAHCSEYIKATQSENLLATAKHFPGHGDTETDSHKELPILNKSLQVLNDNELIPFRAAIQQGVKSIMVGHLMFTDLDDTLPASLSRSIVTELLRNQLSYDGLILTDALDMKAVSDKYGTGELSELAFKAGNDILLMPDNVNIATERVSTLLANDDNLRKQAVESVKRIYAAKRFAKLIPGFAKQDTKPNTWLQHLNLALKSAYNAVISESSDKELALDTQKQFAAFAILQHDNDLQSSSRFFTMLAQATENDCDFAYIDISITDEQIEEFKKGIEDAEFLVFAIFSKGRAYQDSFGFDTKLSEMLSKLAGGRPIFVAVFGNPYVKIESPNSRIVYTFSDSFPSLAAAVMKFAGRELIDDIRVR